jgi:pSer/pThr/pTyr-binding forkhead associated (FHA) protein
MQSMTKLQLSSDKYQFLAEDAQQTFLLGRLAECQFVVQDTTVSRKHAEVFCRAAGWFVRDVGSKHGLWLNGIPVKTARLKHGDELQLGELTFKVQIIREGVPGSGRLPVSEPAAAPEPAPQGPVHDPVRLGGAPSATTIMRHPPRAAPASGQPEL